MISKMSQRTSDGSDPEIFRLAALGEVSLARKVERHLAATPEDFQFDDIVEVIGGADLRFALLANAASRTGSPNAIMNPHIVFRCDPDNLSLLQRLGIHVVSLAHNHIMDFGEAAVHETIEQLDDRDIGHVGAGRNYEDANQPLLLECNGKKVAFLGHSFIYSASTRMATRKRAGVSDHRMGKILPRIRELARSGYMVIVSIHWGLEYALYPLPYNMRQGRQMIEHGASLILGHGPHYPQGMEWYGEGRILYSLGNFMFDEPYHFSNRSFFYQAGRHQTEPDPGRDASPDLVGQSCPEAFGRRRASEPARARGPA